MTATRATHASPAIKAAQLSLAGRVQGLGVRPAIARFAEQLGVRGYVSNTLGGVELHIEGDAGVVEQFCDQLTQHLPELVQVSSCQRKTTDFAGHEAFRIVSDGTVATRQHVDRLPRQVAEVPLDVVVCNACLDEVRQPGNRRSAYAFTSCTACGPRYSILEAMPYERARTSMAQFSLCDLCREEYTAVSHRRFHAQTNACPVCGPQVWLRDADGGCRAQGAEAVSVAADAIRNGLMVALRGLGGYQLLVDSTSESSVHQLRVRKQRPSKPLAVMVGSLKEAEKLAVLDDAERQVLGAPEGPIVVVQLRADAGLPPSWNQGLSTIGLMLPTTPLHALLLDEVQRPVVCTSANLEGHPMVYQAEAAWDELSGIADLWLEHDRPIRRPIDDSVVRVMAGKVVTLRLGRGMSPLPLALESDEPVVALGAHQKTTIAFHNGSQAVLGPHVGDLDSIATRERYQQQRADLSALYGMNESRLACDQHPDYFTSVWAETQTMDVQRIQHHHAHVVACMLEHGWLDRTVIGVAFDGTGLGDDGTIWGGEFLVATDASYERVGHLRPFPLPGGEVAIRQPWRIATALVHDAVGPQAATQLEFPEVQPASILPVLERRHLSPWTSSAGRLFDGVASLILGLECGLFDGQAAMLLESACDPAEEGQYDLVITEDRPAQLDWRPLIRQLLLDRARHVAPGVMAMRFHRALANAVIQVCRRYTPLPIVFGGGVFQNRMLLELLVEQLETTDQHFGLPGRIPPNDGGIAAGQLAVAVAFARQSRT